ncbi:nucleic-acid-binding protein from transposon X-element [Trichonephila clavipes]|nr:nucleic-acid-binding protein from transposon X-element [Trichonephila clavipes]
MKELIRGWQQSPTQCVHSAVDRMINGLLRSIPPRSRTKACSRIGALKRGEGRRCLLWYNRKTNTNMPLFLVTLPKSPESRGIFNIKTIGFFRVAVEPLNKSTMPPQCYRCQEFFHHSRFCARAPKCLKCSGGHLTSDCTKSAKAPAKCANCSGPHPANFSRCPRNPINTKTNKSKSTKNVWQERAAARKENKKQPTTPSFAEVVKKGTNNSSLDAKEVMNQMAQMMSKWGQMLSHIRN